MMLIGQYDSPFVRRVAVTLKLYGLAYEHRPWSTFGDADKIAVYNPLIRVPTLVMDDGFVLMDSALILQVIDDEVGEAGAFLAGRSADRRAMLRLCALAAGAADKGVSLLYERALRQEALLLWVRRCRAQIAGALDGLERERAAQAGVWLFGPQLSHADVLIGAMFRFLTEALPGELDLTQWPALQAHSAACERLPAFAEAYQAYRLVPPQ